MSFTPGVPPFYMHPTPFGTPYGFWNQGPRPSAFVALSTPEPAPEPSPASVDVHAEYTAAVRDAQQTMAAVHVATLEVHKIIGDFVRGAGLPREALVAAREAALNLMQAVENMQRACGAKCNGAVGRITGA